MWLSLVCSAFSMESVLWLPKQLLNMPQWRKPFIISKISFPLSVKNTFSFCFLSKVHSLLWSCRGCQVNTRMIMDVSQGCWTCVGELDFYVDMGPDAVVRRKNILLSEKLSEWAKHSPTENLCSSANRLEAQALVWAKLLSSQSALHWSKTHEMFELVNHIYS